MCLDTNRHTTTHFYTLAAQVTSTLFERYKSKTTTWKAGLRFFPLKLPVQFRPIPFTEPVNGLFAVAAGCAICLPDHFWLTCWKKLVTSEDGEPDLSVNAACYGHSVSAHQIHIAAKFLSSQPEQAHCITETVGELCHWLFFMWILNPAPMLDDVAH